MVLVLAPHGDSRPAGAAPPPWDVYLLPMQEYGTCACHCRIREARLKYTVRADGGNRLSRDLCGTILRRLRARRKEVTLTMGRERHEAVMHGIDICVHLNLVIARRTRRHDEAWH